MPYIITFCTYKPNLGEKVAERYLKLLQKLPVPNYIKRLVPAASAASEKGIEVINVDEVKRDKLGDAIDYAGKFMIEFRDIEGFRWETKVFSTVAEGLSYIGMG